MPSFVSVDSVDFSYRPDVPVLKKFSCLFLAGRVTGLLGPSGSGKSTLLRLIAGLDRPQRGSVSLTKDDALIAYVSQDPVLFEQYSRLENARYRQKRGAYKSRFSETHFKRLTEVLRLDEKLLNQRRPYEPLSGGQRQRLILLRELSILPDLLLLDEPCTGLDSAVKREFLVLLRQVLEEFGIRCLYATHHFDELRLIGDEIVYLPTNPPEPFRAPACDIGDFAVTPPTRDAALAVAGPLATALGVTGIGAVFVPSPAKNGSVDYLIFSEEAASLSDEGFPVNLKSRTSCAAIVSIADQTVIVGKPNSLAGDRLRLRGPALFFSNNTHPNRVQMDTLQVGHKWSIYLSPLS